LNYLLLQKRAFFNNLCKEFTLYRAKSSRFRSESTIYRANPPAKRGKVKLKARTAERFAPKPLKFPDFLCTALICII
jgi:hypothetical protein